MENELRKKTLLICGVVCSICGLIIFVISLFDGDAPSYSRISLGVINAINGGLFIVLSRKK